LTVFRLSVASRNPATHVTALRLAITAHSHLEPADQLAALCGRRPDPSRIAGRERKSVRPTMTETVHTENGVLGGVMPASISHGTWRSGVGPVVVIERGLIGGSCPHIACLPSRNVIRTATVAFIMRVYTVLLRNT
jgi:hypothetical protein